MPEKKLMGKLIRIYDIVDHIDKLGHNKSQNYTYVRATDLIGRIRKEFFDAKIYAEVNFDFVGGPFTIAREKAPNAPFSAVLCKCSIVFHDEETGETTTASGLGEGCDNNDKSAGKAQTNALKYALRNATLMPDEAADPETDESVDRDTVPDFQKAQHAPAAAKTQTTSVSNSATAATPETSAATVSGVTSELPTEVDLAAYTKQLRAIGDNLSDPSKVGVKANLIKKPVGRKILAFLLQTTKADDARKLTKDQWSQFFQFVDSTITSSGYKGLSDLIEAANQ